MGDYVEEVFENITECPFCKGKKLKCAVTRNAEIFHADYSDEESPIFWGGGEDEYSSEDYHYSCEECGKEFSPEEY